MCTTKTENLKSEGIGFHMRYCLSQPVNLLLYASLIPFFRAIYSVSKSNRSCFPSVFHFTKLTHRNWIYMSAYCQQSFKWEYITAHSYFIVTICTRRYNWEKLRPGCRARYKTINSSINEEKIENYIIWHLKNTWQILLQTLPHFKISLWIFFLKVKRFLPERAFKTMNWLEYIFLCFPRVDLFHVNT